MSNLINKKCIVRGNRSGMFFGTVVRHAGQEVELKNCRRLWYWNGAASNFQLAAEGVKYTEDCKFTVVVESITLCDAIELLPCTPEAITNLEAVPTWKK